MACGKPNHGVVLRADEITAAFTDNLQTFRGELVAPICLYNFVLCGSYGRFRCSPRYVVGVEGVGGAAGVESNFLGTT